MLNYIRKDSWNSNGLRKGGNACEPLTATKPFKRPRDVPRAVRMGKEETLLKLKEAESQIRSVKDAAEQEREQVLRNARREALELRERLREQAEARYREILAAAEGPLKAERERILAAGHSEAAKLTARGQANVERAANIVLEKFRGALRA